jgi:peroxiredoxin
MSNKLLPGSNFPSVTLPVVKGTTITLRANGKPTLLVFYRGLFCPFCIGEYILYFCSVFEGNKLFLGTLTELNSKVEAIYAAGIDVIAVSADKKPEAEKIVEQLNLKYPVAYGLEESDMALLGLYVSNPTSYIPQTHRFSEPASFFLRADNSIQYVEIASFPMGARVNVDNLLAGYQWSLQRGKEVPAFANYSWGSIVPSHRQ